MKNIRDEPTLAGEGSIKQAEVYSSLNYGPGLAGRLLKMSHTVCEQSFGPDTHFSEVLEVGAGSGHHIHSVRHKFDRYVMSDLNPDYLKHLIKKLPPSAHGQIQVDAQDATRLTYPDSSFDRLIATHVLEHLPEPHRVIREWARVLKPGGVLSLVLPCDPGLAWRIGRNFGPRASAVKQGIPYDYVMAREHINPIGNLVTFVRHTFPQLKEIWSPLPVGLSDLNLFYICHARV